MKVKRVLTAIPPKVHASTKADTLRVSRDDKWGFQIECVEFWTNSAIKQSLEVC